MTDYALKYRQLLERYSQAVDRYSAGKESSSSFLISLGSLQAEAEYAMGQEDEALQAKGDSLESDNRRVEILRAWGGDYQ